MLCLSCSSIESHTYTVSFVRWTHQVSSFLESEGRRQTPSLSQVRVFCRSSRFGSIPCILSIFQVVSLRVFCRSSRLNPFFGSLLFFLYYEQLMNRELQGLHVSGCRCNERLKPKTDGSGRWK